ncbi:hypothetical protein C7S18_08010 [Ahniella affigens]|uniref:Cytochrome P450 n=1 Tax=Ahniella affigens TaxID=2021234 RepID=A0A2P1PQM1_9GAMM|nr:cytochrome P450 [Ahniella affigens]AVP97140.1 hypothetical protein C7S18_08010 [Ahniella affigens]
MNEIAERPSTGFRFNPYSPAYLDDPYPTFKRMREQDPIYRYRTLGDGEWILTRHADVRAILTDKRFGVLNLGERVAQKVPFMPEDAPGLQRLSTELGSWLFFVNPPDHSRLRHVVSRDFTANAIARVRPLAEDYVLTAFRRLEEVGHIDLMEVIARPLPAVITAAVLGLQRADVRELVACSESLFSIFEQPISFRGYREMAAAADTFRAFFEAEFVARANKPSMPDLLGKLLSACDRDLSHAELISFSAMLFSVGQETSENYIGNSVMALLQHREQFQTLIDEPALLPEAALELARYDSAVQFVTRVPTEDVMIDDQLVRAGDRLYLALGAANRDPAVFEHPDQVNIRRTETSNLPFGSGIHFCLGSALARMMVEVVLERLIHYPTIRLVPAETIRRKTILLRGVRRLTLELPKVSRSEVTL